MALGHSCAEKQDVAIKTLFFLLQISVSTIFSYVSSKLGIGYRNGIAPCHYGCSAFQGGRW